MFGRYSGPHLLLGGLLVLVLSFILLGGEICLDFVEGLPPYVAFPPSHTLLRGITFIIIIKFLLKPFILLNKILGPEQGGRLLPVPSMSKHYKVVSPPQIIQNIILQIVPGLSNVQLADRVLLGAFQAPNLLPPILIGVNSRVNMREVDIRTGLIEGSRKHGVVSLVGVLGGLRDISDSFWYVYGRFLSLVSLALHGLFDFSNKQILRSILIFCAINLLERDQDDPFSANVPV